MQAPQPEPRQDSASNAYATCCLWLCTLMILELSWHVSSKGFRWGQHTLSTGFKTLDVMDNHTRHNTNAIVFGPI